MSKFKKIGGRYGFHSGSGKMKNLEVTGNAWVGGMPIGVIQGDVWYVDSNVNVSGNGQTWDTAMSTIQAAVTAASGYDTIFVAGTVNQESSGTLTSDYSEDVIIPAATMGLKIIGLGNSPEGIAWTCSAADKVCLTVNARDCYVSGFRFRPNGATSSVGIAVVTSADMAENAMGFTVENCIFRSTTTTALAGITINGTNDVTIRGCKFTSVLTGIRSISPGHSVQYRTVIEDCFFDDKCTNGIVIDGRSCVIRNNIIGIGLTMTLQTSLFSVGKENVIYNNVIPAAAYETNAAGYVTDCWLGNKCIDTGNTDVDAAGNTLLYPNRA